MAHFAGTVAHFYRNNHSDVAGIYALFFYGGDFPYKNYQPKVNEIIYIGKTEISQLKRDAETHFANGKTGGSTLRKTFGAFLMDELKLKPIPRGKSDIQKNKITNFKFDKVSEARLTEWMKNNLGLSYYPYSKSANELDDLETNLIREQIPLLNIDWKNQQNPYLKEIKALRKSTGLIAFGRTKQRIIDNQKTSKQDKPIMENTHFESSTIHKYVDIWEYVTPKIFEEIKKQDSVEIHLNESIFRLVGNRKSYSFNLEFINAEVSNNISGSAVARDLARVLRDNTEFLKHSKGKRIKINMDSYFVLHIQCI